MYGYRMRQAQKFRRVPYRYSFIQRELPFCCFPLLGWFVMWYSPSITAGYLTETAKTTELSGPLRVCIPRSFHLMYLRRDSVPVLVQPVLIVTTCRTSAWTVPAGARPTHPHTGTGSRTEKFSF